MSPEPRANKKPGEVCSFPGLIWRSKVNRQKHRITAQQRGKVPSSPQGSSRLAAGLLPIRAYLVVVARRLELEQIERGRRAA